MITITYITITYQAETTLGPTLDSVLGQDYEHIEHIIVDGASTDGTLNLATDYAHRSDAKACGHRVLITSEPDQGIYDAMNKGLRSATGDYVCFLNAGDRLPTTHTASDIARVVEQAVDVAMQQPAVVYGDTDIVDQQGRFLAHRHLSAPERLGWRSFCRGMLVCHQAFYARSDYAVQTPFDTNFRFSADVDWCIRIMRQAHHDRAPLVNAHAVVAHYLGEGTTTRNHKASLRERFAVMRRHYGLPLTLAMHAWFVVRSLLRKLRGA